MKRFGWRGRAVQNLADSGNGFVKHEESSSEDEIHHPAQSPHIYTPRPRSPGGRHGLDIGPECRRSMSFDSGIDPWENFVVPDSPPPSPVRLFGIDPASPEPDNAGGKPSSRQSNKSFDYKQAMVSYISTGHLPTPAATKRILVIEAPLPEAMPAPIKIIVTSPSAQEGNSQFSADRPSDSIMSRNIRKSSRVSLQPQFFDPLPKSKMDKTRLMPPVDDQLDVRKRRKADEFHKIRSFLIEFLNSKGDQFPAKLRFKIMGLYKIRQEDLAPEMRARLEWEALDEGIVLHLDDADGGLIKGEGGKWEKEKEDHMELLKMAFRSQYLGVLPQYEPVTEGKLALTPRLSKTMPSQNPYRLRKPPRSPGSVVAEPAKDKPLPPSRPFPDQTTSATERTLRGSSSVPNLQARPRRISKSTPSSSSVPTICTPSGSVTDLRLGQGTKRRLLAGAFGAVREAMGVSLRMRNGL